MALRRRTKLVCTIGPATVDRIDDLVGAGMDVARLNFSHGEPAFMTRAASRVRAASQAADRPVALLADLSGPKIRLGDLDGETVTLEPGARFTLRPTGETAHGNEHGAFVSYPGLAVDIRPGDRILLADGAVELRVARADEDVETEVVRGGAIRSRAGVSVPSERLSMPALTAKDRADIPRALELGVDYVAQSFVRRAEDVVELRRQLGETPPPIVAKIETRPAIDGFAGILDVADAVMIARGDLGVELPFEEVPLIQKDLVRQALERGIPTIVATQMLESMVAAPRPTRAEASDVANAVFDGADAIMLSGETAIGRYPVLAADAAVRIAGLCDERGSQHAAAARDDARGDVGALASAAVALASSDPEVVGIACATRTGWTARMLASLRPRVPVYAFADEAATVNRLALVHGVLARLRPAATADEDRAGIVDLLAAADLPPGAAVVVVSSTRPDTGPNAIEVIRVPDPGGSAGRQAAP